MITERMLELLIIDSIFKEVSKNDLYKSYMGENYDLKKMQQRYDELGNEFLEPYHINVKS